MANQQDIMKQTMGKVIANAWVDEVFKARLLSNPRSVLADVGLLPPPQIEILFVENTPQHYYLPVPSPWMDMSDPTLMQRLQQNPAAVLSEAGIHVPEQATINLLQNTATRTHIVLPVAPSPTECSIEKL